MAENGDGGGDDDSLRFYVAITLPQMPMSEINGVVNLFSMQRAKRDIIFGACWRDCSARCEIKFSSRHTTRLVCSTKTRISGGLSCCIFGFFII